MNTPLRTTPADALSCTPAAPLYIGHPASVWVVIRTDPECDEPVAFRLFVDEESARHAMGWWVRETLSAEGDISDSEQDDAANEAMVEWVPGVGTTWRYRRDYARDVTLNAYKEEVWTATATGEKTLSLARRDALGFLGR